VLAVVLELHVTPVQFHRLVVLVRVVQEVKLLLQADM
jgi:hypothetical protein